MSIRSSIPVQPMTTQLGVFISKIASKDFHINENPDQFNSIKESHRDEYHLFLLQEKGTTTIEIDFNQYIIDPETIIFIHQNQVHRFMDFENATVSIWAISNEILNSEYLKLLEDITPAHTLILQKDTFEVILEAVSLCLKLAERKDEKLYRSLFTGSSVILTGLVISQYLIQSKPTDKLSRFEIVTKSFKKLLERNFVTVKSPKEYATKLNISTPYLNECIKKATGHSVSHHIQQRVILEAQRLLYYSEKSVKEIATELGYNDYQYFSRLFTKVAGMSALEFRKKNLD
ncbi:helix-turn-helix domain-containing protein [Epilithonimonas hungarica]|uniref:AraC-type DNA-binding protein n=1 Tax=Epilithonimonas hungarica TaxID=454006 RepID=A0A1G7SSC5_9FLAO|nr:helix-turn-helix transcriptional regulator [Epilithonimonas hungarica]SDG26016.1 AraC-type DNA-binding protein [Epilithonimonas hungarica]